MSTPQSLKNVKAVYVYKSMPLQKDAQLHDFWK